MTTTAPGGVASTWCWLSLTGFSAAGTIWRHIAAHTAHPHAAHARHNTHNTAQAQGAHHTADTADELTVMGQPATAQRLFLSARCGAAHLHRVRRSDDLGVPAAVLRGPHDHAVQVAMDVELGQRVRHLPCAIPLWQRERRWRGTHSRRREQGMQTATKTVSPPRMRRALCKPTSVVANGVQRRRSTCGPEADPPSAIFFWLSFEQRSIVSLLLLAPHLSPVLSSPSRWTTSQPSRPCSRPVLALFGSSHPSRALVTLPSRPKSESDSLFSWPLSRARSWGVRS